MANLRFATRDEWEARIVERTLCNDWKSKVEKQLWSIGPCDTCHSLVISADKGEKIVDLCCDCGAKSATMVGGEVLAPCEKCGSRVNAVVQEVKFGTYGETTYTRYSCRCGYYKLRLD